jgi:heme exporter protein A
MGEQPQQHAQGRRTATLDVRELTCSRGERVLFAPTSFVAGPGDIVWLRGGNGQGKTTLLRTLAGLASPGAGHVAWQGTGDAPPRRVYLAHANAIKDELTVRESLRFLLDLDGLPVSEAELDDALDRFGLFSRRHAFVRTLSQGLRRRVALARLAAQREPLPWLLDEPFDALDAAGVEVLCDLVAGHARRGGCVVLTSHLPVPITDPVPAVVHLHEPALA